MAKYFAAHLYDVIVFKPTWQLQKRSGLISGELVANLELSIVFSTVVNGWITQTIGFRVPIHSLKLIKLPLERSHKPWKVENHLSKTNWKTLKFILFQMYQHWEQTIKQFISLCYLGRVCITKTYKFSLTFSRNRLFEIKIKVKICCTVYLQF